MTNFDRYKGIRVESTLENLYHHLRGINSSAHSLRLLNVITPEIEKEWIQLTLMFKDLAEKLPGYSEMLNKLRDTDIRVPFVKSDAWKSGANIVTRDGRNVRILWDRRKSAFNDDDFYALVENGNQKDIIEYDTDGKFKGHKEESPYDLFMLRTKHRAWVNIMKPKKHSAWVNITRDDILDYSFDITGGPFPTKESAIAHHRAQRTWGYDPPRRVDTVKVEWEDL